MKTLVIIPAFNEEDNIETCVNKVKALNYEYIVINDCSTDKTAEVLNKNGFSCINLPKNIGISGVTKVGFEYAREHGYECVVCVDGDGQHQPMYVPNLVEAILEGNDYVVGSRYVDKKKPWSARMIGSRILSGLIKLKTGKTVKDPTSGMRAIGPKVLEEFTQKHKFHYEPDSVCYLFKNDFKVKEVQVEMLERSNGKSYFIKPTNAIKFMVKNIWYILFECK